MIYYNEYKPRQGIDIMKPAELCKKGQKKIYKVCNNICHRII